MYFFSLLFFLLPLNSCCFNIDTNHFIVYVDPEKIGNASFSYFGYTALLYPGNKTGLGKWVKIGAPKGNDPKITKYKSTGVVYNCPFMQKCEPLDIKRGYFKEEEILKGAWIGGSMDINYKFNQLVICGYRTIYKRRNDFDPLGCCYLSDLNATYSAIESIPLEDYNKKFDDPKNPKVYNYGKGEAGFSTHIPEKVNNIILGAPGVFNWAGTVVNIEDQYVNEPTPSRLRMRRSMLSPTASVADVSKQTINSAFELFGYSVCSGYFFGKKLYYAASAPKYRYKGKVAMIEFNGDSKPVIETAAIVGYQIGEYFGAATAAGDVNRDGFDDLMVGAPYHTQNTFNEGAVYIYLGKNRGPLRKQHTLYGRKINGQFGSTIMFLGDLNNDGFGDLAIGAPYEEDSSGVLYIYKGNKDGIDRQPCQRIVGKDISGEIRGFGISISRPADMDGNGYKDLIVGAYLSGHAVLLKTKPIVVVLHKMKSIPQEIKQDTKQFLINICYEYTNFEEDSLDLNRTLILDEQLQRAVLKDPKERTKIITIKKQPFTCENVTLILRNTTNKVAPITAFLSYKLVSREEKKEVINVTENYQNGTNSTFCKRCPILDEFRSSQFSSIDVPFSLGCGSDNFCDTKLTVDAKFVDLREENIFLVGSMDYLDLQIVINNTGENAYFTKLEVTLPDIITFRQIPSGCYEQNISVIICDIDNPLEENAEKTQILNLDMKKINKNSGKNEIQIALRVTTTSNNSNPEQTILTLSLKREADIMISGKSGQQSVPFGNSSYGMPNFTQTYQVDKIGASPLERVQVNITIPHSIKTSSGKVSFIKVFRPDGIFAGQLVPCTSNFEYIVESQSTAITEKLESDSLLLRAKREVEAEVFQEMEKKKYENIIIEGKEYDLVPNRTHFLNCSMDDVMCSSILCTLGPFEKRQISGIIQIKMMFDPSAISRLIGEKDMVFYTTEGRATIQVPADFVQNGNRPDFVQVSSLFIDETKRSKKVALWIIILAVIAGILLLALIIYGLTKAGFFKRAKKEELKNLKAATQQMIEAEGDPQTTDGVISSSTEDLDQDPVVDPTINASTEGLVEDQKEDNVFK